MDLKRVEITPALRQALEPLILDVLFEYSVRHRTKAGLSREAVVSLTLTQAMEVLAAHSTRWKDKLGPVLEPLALPQTGLPGRTGALMDDMLVRMHEFLRREGALTFRAAAEVPNEGQRFGLLWAEVFSHRILDWLRENELVTDPDHLEIADVMVECAKLWTQELSRLLAPKIGPVPEPSAFFLDSGAEVVAQFERGPIKLRIRGRPELFWVRNVAGGFHLHACRLGEPETAALQVVRAVFYIGLLERRRKQPCVGGAVAFFRSRTPHGPGKFETEVESAFAGFIGNAAVVRKLKSMLSAALRQTPPALAGHYLLVGATGLGKTELARRVARGLGAALVELSADLVKTPDDVMEQIDRVMLQRDQPPLKANDTDGRLLTEYPPVVLLIREISNGRRLQGLLMPLTQSRQRTINIGSRTVTFQALTVIVEADDPAIVPEGLLESCKRLDLEPYRPEEVAMMLRAFFADKPMSVPDYVPEMLAGMGRCNPGRALDLAEKVSERYGSISGEALVPREALLQHAREHWHVDERGLTAEDFRYLQALESGPKGLPALQQLLPSGGDQSTAELEAYLVHIGAVYRSARGRVLTVLGEQLLDRHHAQVR